MIERRISIPRRWRRAGALPAALLFLACRGELSGPAVVTFPGSALGGEAEVLRRQLDRFMREHPDIRVVHPYDENTTVRYNWLPDNNVGCGGYGAGVTAYGNTTNGGAPCN